MNRFGTEMDRGADPADHNQTKPLTLAYLHYWDKGLRLPADLAAALIEEGGMRYISRLCVRRYDCGQCKGSHGIVSVSFKEAMAVVRLAISETVPMSPRRLCQSRKALSCHLNASSQAGVPI